MAPPPLRPPDGGARGARRARALARRARGPGAPPVRRLRARVEVEGAGAPRVRGDDLDGRAARRADPLPRPGMPRRVRGGGRQHRDRRGNRPGAAPGSARRVPAGAAPPLVGPPRPASLTRAGFSWPASGHPREEPSAGKPHARIRGGESRMAELPDHPPPKRTRCSVKMSDTEIKKSKQNVVA